MAEAERQGNRELQPLRPGDQPVRRARSAVPATTAKPAPGRRRKYLHDAEEAAPYRQEPGTFTPWEDLPTAPTCCSTRPARRASSTDDVNIARHADLLIGVVPVINLEWIQKLHRDKSMRGYSTEAVTDTILRRMPDYVNYICPQFSHTARQFPARADGRHVQPVHRPRHPDAPTRAWS